MNDMAQQLERLQALRDSGSLSDEEFQSAKQKVLNEEVLEAVPVTANSTNHPTGNVEVYGFTEPTWCMMMHLSQLFIFAGGIGIVVPIVLWLISKDKSTMANRHGNRMMNWIISVFIYLSIAWFLCMFLIGFPILIALILLQVAFPVLAGVKANEGQLWSYPMAIRFFPEN